MRIITEWRWKGVGVRDEEPTKSYIKLTLAPQMGQGIIPNSVRDGQRISFLELSVQAFGIGEVFSTMRNTCSRNNHRVCSYLLFVIEKIQIGMALEYFRDFRQPLWSASCEVFCCC